MVIDDKIIKVFLAWLFDKEKFLVSIVTSSAFQLETNVLTENVYLTSREISVRILLHNLGYAFEIMRYFMKINQRCATEYNGIVSEMFHLEHS